MEITTDRLSANLRNTYAAYKSEGSLPLVLEATDEKKRSHVTAVPPREFFPHTTVSAGAGMTATEKPFTTLPNIHLQSSYNHLPQVSSKAANAQRFSKSEELTLPNRPLDESMMYEYEVEDAAGIPSTGFFNKAYSIPVNRQGRVGASWRHIKQCTGYGGTNLMFVEGSIKDEDIKKYPPYGIVKSNILVNHLGQRLLPKRKGSSYIQKARNGFKYWYSEPKKNILEPPPKAVRTISGQQYKIKGL